MLGGGTWTIPNISTAAGNVAQVTASNITINLAGARMTVTDTGIYRVEVTGTLSTPSTDEWSWGFLDGSDVLYPGCEIRFESETTSASSLRSYNITAILSISAGGEVRWRAKDTGGRTHTVYSGSFSIWRIA
jgi:hypothetical protein